MPDRVCLATLVRPRGLKGEIIAEPGGDWSPDQLLSFSQLFLHPSGRSVVLEKAWVHQNRLVLKLAGFDQPEQAETLRGQELSMAAEARPTAPEGEFYVGDLNGCRVILFASAKEIGTVTNCLNYGGSWLLEVELQPPSSAPALIPFVNAICKEVDIAQKRIVIDPPEGLLDL